MTEEDLTRHRWWVKRHFFIYIKNTGKKKNTQTATFCSVTHRSRGEQTKKNDVNVIRGRQIVQHAPQNRGNHRMSSSKTWWRCGWREVEEQSLTVQRKAEHDQMILYTFPWWPFSPSAIQHCIAALDPSLKHTSMVTYTHTPSHTHTHAQTGAPRWAASKWKNEATEKASGRKHKNGPELLVCYLSELKLSSWGQPEMRLLVRIFTHKLTNWKKTQSVYLIKKTNASISVITAISDVCLMSVEGTSTLVIQ